MAESTEHVEGGNLSPISPLNEDTEDEDVGGANTTPMCPPNEDVKDEDVESAKTTCNCPPKVPCILVVVVGAVFLIVGALAAGLPAGFIGFWKGKSECVKDPSANCPFSKAAVAADSEKCSRIGRDILQKGGSAVDAAIAALLCTSIINPQCAGIGGGVIFTVMDSSDSRWIGVPGEIRGYEAAHRLYGKLPWADLFQPTIKLAREGFPIPYYQGQHIPRIGNTSLRKLYLDKNGNLLKTGDTVKFEKLADTLEMIANEGPDVFYNGTIAKNLTSDIQKAGGKLTLEDLASYQANVTDAWNISLGDYKMYFPPPPSGGAILSLILNIMKGYKMNSEPKTTDEKILFYHRYIEALKFANELKKDPNSSSDGMAKKLTQDSFADSLRSLISSDKTRDPGINLYLDSIGTTHVSVLAEDGSAVSVTSSINDEFGSGVLSPSTGIILNNQLSDFCGRADSFSPGERPPSNMAPSVLKSQSKTLVIGGSGSETIPPAVASALMNHLWFGKSLKEAIITPVVLVDSQSEVKPEPKLEKDVVDGLEALGHKIVKFYNTVNAVEKAGSCISAWSDERKKGKAAGY
ncbi:glutathione hydrolase 5 proenzyme-like isoform X2 [Simochromis diagramma]|uniref:glutathione hydrolase 5 proenzyme-like isoform X2 n=1 Tax=Simochromis diagramma TaxID=43689 RepID=UPI001A7EF880|nr:glutathione hydrolase 5 proenzyme-like isoform X2 [Simochromis diagramma]